MRIGPRQRLVCFLAALALVSGCKATRSAAYSAVAEADTPAASMPTIQLTTDQKSLLREFGQAILAHVASFHDGKTNVVGLSRCQGCSRQERRKRWSELLKLGRSPDLEALIDRTYETIIPAVVDQLVQQAGPDGPHLDEGKILELFDSVDSLKDLAAALAFRAGAPGQWSQYFASLGTLREAVAVELQKDDVEAVDWQLVRDATDVVSHLFALSPYDLTPTPLSIDTKEPQKNVTYRALFFARGAGLWLSSVLVEHQLYQRNPPKQSDFASFDALPQGLPSAVYDDEAKYSDVDRATLKSIGIVLTQLEIEPDKSRVVKGLKMVALGIRMGKLKDIEPLAP